MPSKGFIEQGGSAEGGRSDGEGSSVRQLGQQADEYGMVGGGSEEHSGGSRASGDHSTGRQMGKQVVPVSVCDGASTVRLQRDADQDDKGVGVRCGMGVCAERRDDTGQGNYTNVWENQQYQ